MVRLLVPSESGPGEAVGVPGSAAGRAGGGAGGEVVGPVVAGVVGPGRWINQMHEGVQHAARTVVVLSPRYLASAYGAAE